MPVPAERCRVAVLAIAACLSFGSNAWAQDDAERAAALYAQGKYDEAVAIDERVLAARERALGPDHADVAQALTDLARAYRAAGLYDQALAAAQRAVALRERAGGADAVAAQMVLADVYNSLGDAAAARPVAQRALAAAEARGRAHPDTARALDTLAEAYRGAGDFAQALPAAQRGLAIREQVLGTSDPVTAESLNEVALIYAGMRDYDAALPLYERALAIREAALGAQHPRTAESLNNLAALYWALKEYDRALPLFTRALDVKRVALGPHHPATATALTNLAELYRARGDRARAQDFMQQALRAWEGGVGPNHPHTASALNNLAGLYWTAGDYKQAEPLLQRAAAIWQKAFGPDHPDTARAQNLLAAFYQSTGDDRRALELYRDGLRAEDRTLANVFSIASEEQKLGFVERTQGHYFAALSLIHRRFRDDAAAVRFGLELVLRRKGIVLDAQSRAQEAMARLMSGATLAAWQRLTDLRSDLAKRLLSGPGQQDPAAYRAELETMQASIAREEERLSQQSGLVAQDLAQRQVTAAQLAGRLPPGAVLAEFVRIRDWDPRGVVWSPTSRYLVFILTANDRVALIDLGIAEPIDAEVGAALSEIKNPDFLKNVAGYVQRTDAALARLYASVVQPVQGATSARRLIVSPDGELNKVPFAALRTPSGRYLTEEMPLSYVASGRDLVRGASGLQPSVTLLLVADPAFDERRRQAGGEPALRAISYRGFTYPRLPGTAEEAQVIPRLLRGTMTVLEGAKATESAVRAAHSPKILHLATHGFFLEDDPAEASLPSPLGRLGSGRFRGGPAGPMVRSGLALAGANHAAEIARGDDGILTALEVTGMDLHATDLVVLSACETALGHVAVGEGVYGLRRAFVLAGARNLVMSLWQVNDKITRDLMERFYRAYANGDAPGDALRTAQLETIAFLRSKTAASAGGEGVAPVNLWAPFILQQAGVGR